MYKYKTSSISTWGWESQVIDFKGILMWLSEAPSYGSKKGSRPQIAIWEIHKSSNLELEHEINILVYKTTKMMISIEDDIIYICIFKTRKE